MKRYPVSLLAAAMILLIHGTAQGSFWSLPIGGSDDDYANSVRQTADGGVVVAGSTKSFGGDYYDAWVLILNADGSVAWQKTYGGSGSDIASSVQQTIDGGYIVAGGTESYGAGGRDAWVSKLNADGSVAWQKTYGGPGYDCADSVQQTADGGYIVAGSTESYGAGDRDVWVMKLNADGSVAWQKTYGGSDYDSASSIQQTSDGGFIVAGLTYSFGAGGKAWVLKLNADGSVAWQKTYGGSGSDGASSIQRTADGGFVVVGRTTSYGAGGRDAWVLKLNADGSVAWQKVYGGLGDDNANSVLQTADGGYIISGSTGSFGAGGDDAWLMKLNADGSIAWQRTYGGSDYDSASSIQQTSDGGFIIAGATGSFSVGGADAWVLKLDQNGLILGCSAVAVGKSSAIVSATSAVPVDTTAVATSSDGTVTATSVSPSNTTATAATNCTYTPSPAKWGKTYGGSGSDVATSVQQTADGGFIVAGYTDSFGSITDAWVLKLNADGTVVWQKTYGGLGNDLAYSIQQTADGGYVVGGFTGSFDASRFDLWVLKLNADGLVVWQKTYGGSSYDEANSIQQTTDGGYIVAGFTESYGAGGYDAWVLKLNANGSVDWQKTYGGPGQDIAYSVQQTADGGYIVAGAKDFFDSENSHAWVLKLNTDGSVDWQKTYGGPHDDWAYSVKQTADGGYIVAGHTHFYTSDAWVMKLNADGSVAWQRTYGGSSWKDIQQTTDGGYVVAGIGGGAGGGDAWMRQLNADGLVVWQKTYGGSSYDEALSIQQTTDGGFIVAGFTESFGAGGRDAWVLKLDTEGGITGCGSVGISQASSQISVTPVAIPTISVSDSAAQVASPSPTLTNTVVTPGEQCFADYTQHILDVFKGGSGTGVVASSPSGIKCGSDCRGLFTSGTLVALTPASDQTSWFAGWRGACNTNGQVTMNADKYCIALFNSIADFSGTPRSGIGPLEVDFKDLSFNTPSGWLWSFGDGATSIVQNPTHTYLWPGTYPVSLAVTGTAGLRSITKNDYITVNCGFQPVRFGVPPSTWTPSGSIQSAYNSALDGDYVEPTSVSFNADLFFDQDKKITLKGGFNCDYSSSEAFTTIMGSISVGGPAGGTVGVIIENIIIR